MSDSVRPHGQQPTRLSHPWDSPGENSGVGCHFHPQCMKVKSESEVSRSCPTLSDPMDCSPPGSSIQGICQARVLEWVVIAFSVTTARTWKQPRCRSADEWIRKLWYIYTMEYYSAIIKNAFEIVLMRWMKLEPIIQSDISQKEKHQYSILTHIYGI